VLRTGKAAKSKGSSKPRRERAAGHYLAVRPAGGQAQGAMTVIFDVTRKPPARWRFPGQGANAIAYGSLPTLIGLPGLLVAVVIGVMVPAWELTT
jgi:hypothetical protein